MTLGNDSNASHASRQYFKDACTLLHNVIVDNQKKKTEITFPYCISLAMEVVKTEKNDGKRQKFNKNESKIKSLEILSNGQVLKKGKKRKRNKKKGQNQQNQQQNEQSPQNIKIEEKEESDNSEKESQEQDHKEESKIEIVDARSANSNSSIDNETKNVLDHDVKMNDGNDSEEDDDDESDEEKVSKKQKTVQSNVVDGFGEVPPLETNGKYLSILLGINFHNAYI